MSLLSNMLLLVTSYNKRWDPVETGLNIGIHKYTAFLLVWWLIFQLYSVITAEVPPICSSSFVCLSWGWVFQTWCSSILYLRFTCCFFCRGTTRHYCRAGFGTLWGERESTKSELWALILSPLYFYSCCLFQIEE